MNKICSDLEQSKRLQSLGIDVNTADMWWNYYSVSIDDTTPQIIHLDTPWVGSFNWANKPDNIPAWSLSALLEYTNRNFYNISLNYCGSKYTISFDDGERYKTITKDYSIDAAFEMVVWLLENKKL